MLGVLPTFRALTQLPAAVLKTPTLPWRLLGIVGRGLKTHSGTKKRFKKLPSGLFIRGKVGINHLNTGTSGQNIRLGRKPIFCTHTQNKMLAKKMPF